MAEYTYKQLGIPLDLKNLESLNDNFKTIARDLNNLSGDVLAEVIDGAKLIWQEPVDTFADLATTYPTPQEGWAVFVRNVGSVDGIGEVYRFDGTDWLKIQDFDATAINEVDSRLTSQLAETRLEIQETNDSLNDVRERVPEEFGALSLEPHPLAYEPVLTKDDVTDITTKFVADPFLVKGNNIYHMFFEVADMNGLGHIGHATSSDLINWTYDQIVLSDGSHFAYPYVFKFNNEWYMLPDRGSQVPGLTLYKATNFPYDWQPQTQLFSTGSFVDGTLFLWDDVWYLFHYDTGLQQTLIKYSDSLDGEWTSHPSNPFTSGLHLRPGGRPILSNNTIDIFMQDGTNGVYGEKTWQYRITELSKSTLSFSKMEKPVIEGMKDGSWKSKTMHHLDIVFTNRNSLPVAFVDGTDDSDIYSIGVFTVGTKRKKPHVRLVRDSTQSIPHSQWSRVNFDRVVSDTTSSFNSSAQKYIAPETGYYMMSASIAVNFTNTPNPTFVINMRLMQNGLEARTNPKHGISSSFNVPRTYTMSDVILLKKGDEIQLDFFHAAGDSRNIINQGWATWLTLTKID